MAKPPKPPFGKPNFGKPAPRTNSNGKPYPPRPDGPRPPFNRGSADNRGGTDRPPADRPGGDRPPYARPNGPNADRPPYGRPGGDRPPYNRADTDRPPYERSGKPPYAKPPYGKPAPGKPYDKSAPGKPTFTERVKADARATPLPGGRPWEAMHGRSDTPPPAASVPPRPAPARPASVLPSVAAAAQTPAARTIKTKAKSPFVPATVPVAEPQPARAEAALKAPVEPTPSPAAAAVPQPPVSEAAAPPKPAAPKAALPPKKSAAPKTKAASLPPPDAEPVTPLATFSDLELSEPVARAVSDLGFEAPTPIQARSIPLLLAGRDLIGQAQTGTGKTAAFALPLIQQIVAAGGAKEPQTQALILEPTRELAIQVAGGIHDLAKHTGMRVVPVYGGQPLDRQFRALRDGAQVVVGTPGRVLDHLRRGTLSLENVKICVLDEADEMLALGFLEDMETILAELPTPRQLAFFSATMPPRIAALSERFLDNPARVSIDAGKRTVDNTNQTYYEVAPGRKLEALGRVLDMETPGPTIVFCRTRQETNDLADALRLRGYSAESLHGDLAQADRDRVMRRFREGLADLLIATDVAARGLDIETVTHVINYDIPWDVEQYIHRIGRTGRAGRTGDAITLVEGRERRALRAIEQMIGMQIKPVRIPTAADIAARRRDNFQDAVRQTLEAREFDAQMAAVEALSEEYDSTEIAAAALQMLWAARHAGPDEAAEELNADAEQPEVGMTRLFLSIGRQDGVRPGDLVGAISNEANITGKSIGAIDILDKTSFVEVPAPHAARVVDALRSATIRGRRVQVEMTSPAGPGAPGRDATGRKQGRFR